LHLKGTHFETRISLDRKSLETRQALSSYGSAAFNVVESPTTLTNVPGAPFGSLIRNAAAQGCTHSRVSLDWLRGPYRLPRGPYRLSQGPYRLSQGPYRPSSVGAFDHTPYKAPGCHSIGHVDHTGCDQLVHPAMENPLGCGSTRRGSARGMFWPHAQGWHFLSLNVIFAVNTN
jgi:hypothetical protein